MGARGKTSTGGEYAAGSGGAVGAFRAVRRRFLRSAGENTQQRLDALHARIDQRAVAIVELTAARSALGAFRPLRACSEPCGSHQAMRFSMPAASSSRPCMRQSERRSSSARSRRPTVSWRSCITLSSVVDIVGHEQSVFAVQQTGELGRVPTLPGGSARQAPRGRRWLPIRSLICR